DVAKAQLTISDIVVVDRAYNGTTRVELTGGTLVNAVQTDLDAGTLGLDTSSAYGEMATKDAKDDQLLTLRNYTLTGVDQDNYVLTLPTDLTA
ncbi:YDG domain-containing protein, partial [Hyphomonas beringensis]|uniref:YDG domain-containing protein n=1 Tax=Hyphomonas beringensis TaxID=1280946 RepID=UPI000552091A